MSYLFAFIGTGNMGAALARAAVKTVSPEKIILANRTPAKAESLAAATGCAVGTALDAAAQSKFIVLGVKPQMMAALMAEIRPALAGRRDRFILVSMAAGLTIDRIAAMAGGNLPVIRIMPNTPCAVGAGLMMYDANSLVTEEELTEFTAAMSGAGVLDRLEERLIDAGCAVAGCGPAFMALLLETGQHPGAMKDAVCSPGGSAIAGIRALEQHGVRAGIMDAVIASAERNKKLGK